MQGGGWASTHRPNKLELKHPRSLNAGEGLTWYFYTEQQNVTDLTDTYLILCVHPFQR